LKSVVYVLKDKSGNEYIELRYSLRSLENMEHGDVFVIGGEPVWLRNVIHIPAKDECRNKQLNSMLKIMKACEDERITDDFILMNDDFYLLQETDIPYVQKGYLNETVINKAKEYNNSKYWYCMQRTAKLFDNPLDFEVHFPIVYNKKKLLALIDEYDLTKSYLLRSLYCNHYGITGVFSEDKKAYSISELQDRIKKVSIFTSSDDNCANRSFVNLFKKTMDGVFPEQSEYEGDRWINFN
jgi:hypothetical protein